MDEEKGGVGQLNLKVGKINDVQNYGHKKRARE